MRTASSLSQGEYNPWDKYNRENDEVHDGYSTKVLKHLKGQKRSAFDIGCGHGRSARALWKGGFSEVIMSDIHRPPEDKLWNGMLFQQCSAKDFVFPDEYFDGGVMANVSFYIGRSVLRALIPRMHKGLRRGGVIAFNALTAEDIWVSSRGPDKTSWISDSEVPDFTSGFKIHEHKVSSIKPDDPCELRNIHGTPWKVRILVLEKL